MSADEWMGTVPCTHWFQIPDPIRQDFWDWFEEVHDDEEEMYAPGTPPCGADEDCCDKIGQERMVELFEQFLAEQPAYVRQLAYVREDDL